MKATIKTPLKLLPKTTKTLEIKEFLLYHNLSDYLVEARGVEPLSENPSAKASSSTVSKLTFPLSNVH